LWNVFSKGELTRYACFNTCSGKDSIFSNTVLRALSRQMQVYS
jgi:hypothetical protein